VNQAGAKKLLKDWRGLRPDVTKDEIVHFIHEKAAVTSPSSVGSLGSVLVCSAAQYSGLDLDLYREKQQRQREESESREREAQEKQRRAELQRSLKADDPWSRTLAAIRGKINPTSFDTWLAPTRYCHSEGAVLFVRVPNPDFCCIGERYGDFISEAIDKLGLEFTAVEFVSDPAKGEA
jgi:hypothetical protein